MIEEPTTKNPFQTTNAPSRNDLLLEHYPLVSGVVNGMRNNLPSWADMNELHSVGVTGLIAAVDNYRPSRSNTFKAYACLRIRGAILDELRRLDPLPRTRRATHRKVTSVIQELEQEFGRTPTDQEIATRMEVSVAQLEKMQSRSKPIVTISLDGETHENDDNNVSLHETLADDQQRPCFERLEKEELVRELADKIEELPDRTRRILAMYYFEHMRFSEIAAIFEVTEARICQIHSQAIKQLRQLMSPEA